MAAEAASTPIQGLKYRLMNIPCSYLIHGHSQILLCSYIAFSEYAYDKLFQILLTVSGVTGPGEHAL